MSTSPLTGAVGDARAAERVLTLYSHGLLSKWGFNDGDEPDDVADWLEADGIAYRDIPCYGGSSASTSCQCWIRPW